MFQKLQQLVALINEKNQTFFKNSNKFFFFFLFKLGMLGVVIDNVLSFGFNPYILEINPDDTYRDVKLKCLDCLKCLNSRILVLVQYEYRSSLLIPCFR